MTRGLHHVTGITAGVQANVDFYVGFLGLKLVKRTAAMRMPSSCTCSTATASAAPDNC
jgi:catechol 2,3-dioxygenase-like lactoylglutathione lyase family enzyme